MKYAKYLIYVFKLRLRAIRYFFRSFSIKKKIIAKGGRVLGKVDFQIDGNLEVGDNVILSGDGIDNKTYTQIQVARNASLKIGTMSGCSQVSISCKDKVDIGNYVNIGAGSLIIDSNHHSTYWKDHEDRGVDARNARTAPVVIENYVFIGARSIVCKGVRIGSRSIIAAGSVVVSNIPSDCIAGGNPCKVIKKINQ